jgi:hypothetical protein
MYQEFFMKKFFVTVCLAMLIGSRAFSQAETRMDLSLYASTRGEMQFDFVPQWKFPFLRVKSPLTSGNNIALKLDASISPIWAGLTGDAVLTVAPFLSVTAGAAVGTGWNYDLFGKVPLVGLGLNRKSNADDPDDGVIGNGLDGAVWNTHAGITLQFDIAAFFPGEWNHVVMQIYNELQYIAYTNADGDELWYYLGDDGMNQNSFRHNFTCFAGYAMPIFIDLAGVQFSGTLPFYNAAAGGSVRDAGYSLTAAFLVNFRMNEHFSIMTVTRVTNGFAALITSSYERIWGFDRVQFIATWHIQRGK